MSSSKLKGSLSQRALKDQQVDLTTASTVIQTYVQMILNQPDLKLKWLPKLPAHQATARNHAQYWDSTLLPLMSKTDADIIDYANQFDAFYDDLVKYAKDIKNPEAKKKLVEGLKLLSNTIKEKDANAEAVIKDLTTFDANLNTDSKVFLSDINDAKVKIEGLYGASGEIKALNDQLDAIQSAMHKDIGLMAGGATMIVGGVVMIVVGAVLEIPSGGATTVLIGGGVVVVSAGVVMTTLGGLDYKKQISEQKKVSEQLADDKVELTALQATKTQVHGFVDGLSSAIKAAVALRNSWQALDADLGLVVTALDDVDPSTGDWLLDELKRAKSDWEVALEQAKRLQPNGKVPVKVYKDLQDAYNEMKAAA